MIYVVNGVIIADRYVLVGLTAFFSLTVVIPMGAALLAAHALARNDERRVTFADPWSDFRSVVLRRLRWWGLIWLAAGALLLGLGYRWVSPLGLAPLAGAVEASKFLCWSLAIVLLAAASASIWTPYCRGLIALTFLNVLSALPAFLALLIVAVSALPDRWIEAEIQFNPTNLIGVSKPPFMIATLSFVHPYVLAGALVLTVASWHRARRRAAAWFRFEE